MKITKTKSLRYKATVATAVVVLGVAGCSSTDEPDSPDTGGSATLIEGVTLARASSLTPNMINDVAGPLDIGPEFGLTMTESDITAFSSSSTALQNVLSGSATVANLATTSTLLALEEDLPVKIFCPQVTTFDAQIVTTGDIASLEELGDNLDLPIALEGPGGAFNILMDLVLTNKDLDYRSGDFTNVETLEDSSQRLSAMLNGDVNAAVLFTYQVNEVIDELGAENVHVLSTIADDMGDGVISSAYVATDKWLTDNEDAAVAFCASILRANERLSTDFDYFKEMSNKYITPQVEESLLQETWNAINAQKLFPYEPPTITEDGMNALVSVAVESGIISAPLEYTDIVATDILTKAEELAAST